MSTNLQQVSTALLDMDGVANYLHVKGVYVNSEDLSAEESLASGGYDVYSPFVTKHDLDNAGNGDSSTSIISNIGGIKIEDYAVRAGTEGANENQHTVQNALNLNGHTDEYFFAATAGQELENKITDAKDTFNLEHKMDRNELYQLSMSRQKTAGLVRRMNAAKKVSVLGN